MKKTLSLLLVLLMVAVLLPATAELEPGKYPLTEKFGEIELNFLVTDHPAIVDWETNEFVKWIEETTNVDLKFETVPLEGRAEKLSLVLASGTYPDVFMSVGMSSAMISKFGVQEQLFMPLNDLIDKYAPNTLKVFEQYPGSKGLLTQLDGNIYSLPSVNECYHCTVANKFFMNMDWLKAVGMEKPTTLDELYDVLVAFRDKDPNGNGQADEIPLAGAYLDGWNTRTERFIMNAFTYYNLDLTQTNTTSM
jgi:putative aldouronate transport system substrate-binding protein